jgi:23S rRNA (cytidine2498-2'-O)-methyltransferase
LLRHFYQKRHDYTQPAAPKTHMINDALLYCRAGFENESSREFTECAKKFGPAEVVSAVHGSGYVICRFPNEQTTQKCIQSLPFSSLTFSRQIFAASDEIGPLSAGNRVAPLVEAITMAGLCGVDVFIETADTNEAKQLSPLCRKLAGPFSEALGKAGLLLPCKKGVSAEDKRLHVFFTATDRAYVGFSYINNSSSWNMGIPRLRFPAGAPSRSTLKLEEAFHVFLSDEDQSRCLRRRGLTAIDLGASPGGWTWQLVSRGMRVVAVDNGRMDGQLLNSGLVQHIRGDGFTFAPKRPVDWMVCDIVEQPSRIARLAAQWLARKWCRYSIFNLKLPMKKRYEEVCRCRDIIASELGRTGAGCSLQIKQLYHDREEVTAMLATPDGR